MFYCFVSSYSADFSQYGYILNAYRAIHVQSFQTSSYCRHKLIILIGFNRHLSLSFRGCRATLLIYLVTNADAQDAGLEDIFYYVDSQWNISTVPALFSL